MVHFLWENTGTNFYMVKEALSFRTEGKNLFSTDTSFINLKLKKISYFEKYLSLWLR